jgi:lipopolysaccharide transport protein LptA
MRSFPFLVVCLFAVALAPVRAANHSVEDLLEAQQGAPIEINADSSDFDYDSGRLVFRGFRLNQGGLSIKSEMAETDKLDFANGTWTFSGNVEVEFDTASLYCDEAEIRFTGHQLTQAELTGTPASFKQVVAETGEINEGEAGRMLYKLDNGILELRNNARFSDGANEIKGDQITYDVIGRNLSADSGASGPVTILIEAPSQPDKKPPAP